MGGETSAHGPLRQKRWTTDAAPDRGTRVYTPVIGDLLQEIASAQSIDALRVIGARMTELVRLASRPQVDIKAMVPQIARLNDAITLRLLAVMDRAEGIRLPEGAAYLALGSEGRGDQTLRTDQDSAVVFYENLPSDKRSEMERFSTRLVEALEDIGVPRCPGNIMASNPQWRHSLGEWKRRLELWIDVPTPEHTLNFGIFQGLRTLCGDKALEKHLRDHILAAVRRPSLFFPHMALHALRFPVPLTLLGRIRVERRGEHKGKVDIKKAGIFAITVGTSLLALESGFVEGNTWEKLDRLGTLGIISPEDLENIQSAFDFLVQLRLRCQLRQRDENGPLTNHKIGRAHV